ncbi:hypothetical protein GGQ05_001964 [Salinibacter ruber]|jgi:hypothetical protein|uniref:DUF2933 domain-containing protein n=1 Tax=Salinibacter ruber TaxID=146919 RepID=A0A9X2TS93_9BACT|nr:hypothetical protein [Salinibacter ruber]MCS3709675.1 hypothetical protein [Salinibacter ruber]MCS3751459.1 hypothetical protein [Salinibacter ruber]MCS4170498.1 hypothetical protein [Salinibacter ruber]
MGWLAENWFFLLVLIAMIAMHLFGHGHGGHDRHGHGESDSSHEGHRPSSDADSR